MASTAPTRLVILDRDGVINEDSDDYIKSLAEWRPIPGSIPAIASLSASGFLVAVVTNQSGVGRGYFSAHELETMHKHMCSLVKAAGGTLSAVLFCPHLPSENCTCRKPATGLLDALEKLLGLSVKGAWLVGDTMKDLQLAKAKGCKPILVRTGKGSRTEVEFAMNPICTDVLVFNNLAAAVAHILST